MAQRLAWKLQWQRATVELADSERQASERSGALKNFENVELERAAESMRKADVAESIISALVQEAENMRTHSKAVTHAGARTHACALTRVHTLALARRHAFARTHA